MSHTTEDKELFTQGEWDNNLNDGNVLSGGIVVANCYSSLLMPATIKANARLISSTPDLYNALKQLKIVAAETTSNLIAWDGAEPLDAAIDKAEKALNKAIGK